MSRSARVIEDNSSKFVSPDAVLTNRSYGGKSLSSYGAPTARSSGGRLPPSARSRGPSSGSTGIVVPPLGLGHSEAHKRRVQSATGVRKPARLNVGGRTARAYEDGSLSARTLPDIAPLPTKKMVREWPSEVQAGTFRLDLSHMVVRGEPTPRGEETVNEEEPEWRSPRGGPKGRSKEDKRAEELLRSALIQSEPQRVSAPPQVNSPVREDPSLRHTHETEAQRENPVAVIKKDLADCKMLAHACRRAGKIRLEGLAYYKMGVLMDNMRDFKNAIKQYKKFLSICVRTNDVVGEALAYNSIAVGYQLIGGEKGLRKAIEYHTKHRDMADIPGKFTAYCNLGIAYAALGQMDKAVYNHQNALRHAIHMSSLEGESLACANLGVTGAQQGDVTTAKACVERHLQLAKSMRDTKGQLGAHQHLGELAAKLQDFEKAADEFQNVLMLSENDPLETGAAKAAMCALGVARGDAQLDEFMQHTADSLTYRG